METTLHFPSSSSVEQRVGRKDTLTVRGCSMGQEDSTTDVSEGLLTGEEGGSTFRLEVGTVEEK